MAGGWWDSGYVQDPTEGMKSEWTEDGWHKIQGQCRFYPNWSYQEVPKYDSNGVKIWGVKVPNLDSIVFTPKFELACDIWTSNVVSGGVVTQRGEHPIALYVALRDPDRQTLAEWKDGTRKRSYSFRDNYETGVTIKPDTGVYTIEWMIARNEDDGTRDRQPSGSVESTFTFDSNADRLRQKLRIENAM
jgi:hypothetical protein